MESEEYEEGEIVSSQSPPTSLPLVKDKEIPRTAREEKHHHKSVSRPTPNTSIARKDKLRGLLGRMEYPVVDRYHKLEVVGEGTFGTVWRAKSETGQLVALKQVKFARTHSGFPVNLLRELLLLQGRESKNILSILDVTVDKYSCVDYSAGKEASIYIVFPFMDHDLAGLLANKAAQFTREQLRYYFYQLVKGVKYLHDSKILHRDLKSANILIDNEGVVKIGDFGLARSLKEAGAQYTRNVVTLWYRAPELLLGERSYSTAADMWSVGCIFAEMLLKEPIFPGKVEFEQMERIFKVCGTPSESNWKGYNDLPNASVAPSRNHIKRNLMESLGNRIKDPLALDLLDKLLVLDPSQRLTATSTLLHDYFYVPSEVQRFNPKTYTFIISNLLLTAYRLPRYKSSFELNMRRHGKRKRGNEPPTEAEQRRHRKSVEPLPVASRTSSEQRKTLPVSISSERPRFVSRGPSLHAGNAPRSRMVHDTSSSSSRGLSAASTTTNTVSHHHHSR